MRFTGADAARIVGGEVHLGLTAGPAVGYELSPRGRAFLAREPR